MTLELQAQQPQLEKLSEEAVDQDGIDMAQELTENILDKMAEGSYYEFQEGEAIPMLEQQFTEQMQKQQYQMIQSQLGAYEQGLEYQEAYQATQAGQEFTIYRFRAEFSQGQPEVRVVFTPDNQLAGLRVLPWQEQLQ
jgi:hypothetical protein